MAPVTTKSGISALDSAFGGLYLKRATLLLGRHRSGKSTFAAHFLAKTLLSGENAVIFTAKTPAEVTALLDERGVDARQAIEGGQLVVCPYSAMTRSGDGPFAPLPFPQASEELAKLVIDNSISYAIFDSVVPWTAIEPLEKMRDHTEDFVASLEALKLTSLLLLPQPRLAGGGEPDQRAARPVPDEHRTRIEALRRGVRAARNEIPRRHEHRTAMGEDAHHGSGRRVSRA